ncbi:aldo/keto reductase [Mesorhizobium sp. ZC-5]|uniref:aldo/keto reductase n=1 Tax=Mesorhizobium sp. ZC-5 TaxID=2986066 RepID=UPI0021E7AB37|nr:aldo/keto reductase [Mesorhizobium sp. ZC-5]MCV3240406.1 aldo/keto reductase [Mesorhizobium sp. ZC-5]
MHEVAANGARIPAIGLGTWTLKDDQCSDLVSHALAVGYRHVDTAKMYDNEAAVGAGIKASSVPRDDIFLTTKVWWTDLAPADLERSTEGSLKRLGLDHVDLLLIHWPNARIPLEGTIKALNRMRERGLTRHIGVANFPTRLLGEAIALSDAPLVANQVEYHPYLDQTKVHAACRAAGMAMVSYCPLYRGGGLLEEEAIRSAASRLGKTPGQVVLRWHVQQEGVVAIPRTTRKERLVENAAIFDFQLSDAEMTEINALTKANSRICEHDFSPGEGWD